jgi:hypothetical protein
MVKRRSGLRNNKTELRKNEGRSMERPLYFNVSKMEGVDVASGEEVYWEWNEEDGEKRGGGGLDSEIKSETLRGLVFQKIPGSSARDEFRGGTIYVPRAPARRPSAGGGASRRFRMITSRSSAENRNVKVNDPTRLANSGRGWGTFSCVDVWRVGIGHSPARLVGQTMSTYIVAR